MIMVVVEGSSLVANPVWWIAFMMDLWFGGCTIPTPIHFEDFPSPYEPKTMV